MKYLPRDNIWAYYSELSRVDKCCGNCLHYKRDGTCRKDENTVILSTCEKTYCSWWTYEKKPPKK